VRSAGRDFAGHADLWYDFLASLGTQGRPEPSARVVRGGSWNNNQRNARCADRNRNNPNNRNRNNGFRVVAVGGGMALRSGADMQSLPGFGCLPPGQKCCTP